MGRSGGIFLLRHPRQKGIFTFCRFGVLEIFMKSMHGVYNFLCGRCQVVLALVLVYLRRSSSKQYSIRRELCGNMADSLVEAEVLFC